MPVHEIDDPKRLFNSLAVEPERSALLAAFLSTYGRGDAAWTWRAGGATNISFLVYLTNTSYSPILFGFGPPAGIENLLLAARPHIAERVLLHVPAPHAEAVERLFFHEMRADLIFSLTPADLALPRRRATVVELGPNDAGEIEALLGASYPGHFFRAEQLRDGVHLGIREGGRLAAFASAPIVAREFRRAFVSNVVTRADARRKGLAQALNSALAERLFAQGVEIVGLGVFAENAAGRALCESLGYRFRYHVLFGPGTLRGARTPARERDRAAALA